MLIGSLLLLLAFGIPSKIDGLYTYSVKAGMQIFTDQTDSLYEQALENTVDVR